MSTGATARRTGAPALALALALAGPAATRAAPRIETPAPRDFGYFPGAIVTAHATIRLDPGDRLDRESLPETGPLSPEIDLCGFALHTSRQDGIETDRITARFQVFFSPQEPQATVTPPLQLAVRHAGRRETLMLPGFALMVAPFRHDLTPVVDPTQIRADPPRIDPPGDGAAPLAAGGAVLLLLAASLYGAARATARPRAFQAAWRQIRRQRLAGEAAMRALHRGFDHTAGRVVLAADLQRFVEQNPCFRPLAAEIAAFFACSDAAFFGTGAGGFEIAALARRLARAEARA